MKVRIIRTVPGWVNFVHLAAGTEHELEQATAISLLGDGYAELVDDVVGRATPNRETAEKRPGRPRKTEG